MKHTRRRTRKLNFLAKLRRADLNYNAGKFEHSKFKWTSRCAKHKDGISHPNFHGFNQKFADYYGINMSGFVNPWLTHHDGMHDHQYLDFINDENNPDRFEFIRVDCTREFRRKEKHRRKLKKFIKMYGLEHKLLYK